LLALANVTDISVVNELFHVELELGDCNALEVVRALVLVDPPATAPAKDAKFEVNAEIIAIEFPADLLPVDETDTPV
tara:strand:- start:103 stop:333 length:231 start_codon:yes stop_codon:yes gene_type:complete